MKSERDKTRIAKFVRATIFVAASLAAGTASANPYNPFRSATIENPTKPTLLSEATEEVQAATSYKVIDYYSFEVALQGGGFSPSTAANFEQARTFATDHRADEVLGLIAEETGDVEFLSEPNAPQTGLVVALDPTRSDDGRIEFTKYLTFFGHIEGEAVWAGELQGVLKGNVYTGAETECTDPTLAPECYFVAPTEFDRDCDHFDDPGQNSPLTQCDQGLSSIAAQNDSNNIATVYNDNTSDRCGACAPAMCEAEFGPIGVSHVGSRPLLNNTPAPEGSSPNILNNASPIGLNISATVISFDAFETAMQNVASSDYPTFDNQLVVGDLVASVSADEVSGGNAYMTTDQSFNDDGIFVVALDPVYHSGGGEFYFTKSFFYKGQLSGTSGFVGQLDDFYSQPPDEFNACVVCLDPNKRPECTEPPTLGGGCPTCPFQENPWSDCNPDIVRVSEAVDALGFSVGFVDNNEWKCEDCWSIKCDDVLQDPGTEECNINVPEECKYVDIDTPNVKQCTDIDVRIPDHLFPGKPMCNSSGLPGAGSVGALRDPFGPNGPEDDDCSLPEICHYLDPGDKPNMCESAGSQFRNQDWITTIGCSAPDPMGFSDILGDKVQCCGAGCACVRNDQFEQVCVQCDAFGQCQSTTVPWRVDPRLVDCVEGSSEPCTEGFVDNDSCDDPPCSMTFVYCPRGLGSCGEEDDEDDEKPPHPPDPLPQDPNDLDNKFAQNNAPDSFDLNPYDPGPEDEDDPAKPTGKGGQTDGDPVLLSSGALLLDSTDIEFHGGLSFARTYVSNSGFRGSLGSNWRHNFEVRLIPITPTNVYRYAPRFCVKDPATLRCVVIDGPGEQRLFVFDSETQVFMPQAGDSGVIRKSQFDYVLRETDGTILHFDAAGSLFRVRDRNDRGYNVEWEPTPIFSLYQRYCTHTVYAGDYPSILDSTDAVNKSRTARLCEGLARAFNNDWSIVGDAQHDIFEVVSLGYDPFVLPNDSQVDGIGRYVPTDAEVLFPSNTTYTQWINNARAYVTASANASADHELYRVPTGHWKTRPTKVTDLYGRELNFIYDDEPIRQIVGGANPTFGLLKKVEGPAGMEVNFQYDRPTGHPVELAESFLTTVTRETNPTLGQSGTVPTYQYQYQWKDGAPDPAGQATDTIEFYQLTFQRWVDFYRTFLQCRDLDEFSSSCLQIEEERPGAPCEWARTNGLDYMSAAADNIVRVIRNGDVESETFYDIQPTSDNFDRAVEQRFGGKEIHNPTINGYLTQYPTFKFEYLEAGPHLHGIDITQASVFLPDEIKARYPMEGLPGSSSDPSVPDFEFATQHQAQIAPNSPGNHDPTVACGPSVIASQCEDEDRPDRQSQLPGFDTTQPYFDHTPPSSRPDRPMLKRSWLTCGQLALRQTQDPTHNDLINRKVTSTMINSNGTLRDTVLASCGDNSWSVSEHPLYETVSTECLLRHRDFECAPTLSERLEKERDMQLHCPAVLPTFDLVADPQPVVTTIERAKEQRRIIEQNNQRICKWAKVTDRDQRERWYGMNYRGQALVQADYDSTDGKYYFTETVYNADGNVIEQRETTDSTATLSQNYTKIEYDEETWETGYEDIPGYWNRRSNVKRVRQVSTTAVLADDGAGNTVAIDERQVAFTYDPFFNQPLTIEESVQSDTTNLVIRTTNLTLDYQEMALGAPFGPVARGLAIQLRPYGFDLPMAYQQDSLGYNVPHVDVTSSAFLNEVPPFLASDVNGDGVTSPSDVAEFRLRFRGNVVKREVVAGTELRASTTVFNEWGLPTSTRAASGAETFFSYYANAEEEPTGTTPDFFGNGQRPDASNSDPTSRGMLAAVEVNTTDPNYDLAAVGIGGLESPCDPSLGPYGWIPDCQGYASLNLPLEVTDYLNDLSTNGKADRYAFTYEVTGHPASVWSNEQRTDYTRDVDGRLLTENMPSGAVRTVKYDKQGRPILERIQESDETVKREVVTAYDNEDRPIMVCTAYQPYACNGVAQSPPPVGTVADPNRVAGSVPKYGLALYEYSDEGLLKKTSDSLGVVTENVRNDRGQVVTQITSDGTSSRTTSFTYDARGNQTGVFYGPSNNPTLAETVSFDGFGQVETRVDTRGKDWTYSYDVDGNLTVQTHVASGRERRQRYNGFGERIAVTDGDPSNIHALSEQTYHRTEDGRLVAIEETGSGFTYVTFDNSGEPVWWRDGEGNFQFRTWDRDTNTRTLTRVNVDSETGAYLPITTVTELDDNNAPIVEQVIGANQELQTTTWTRDQIAQVDVITDPENRTTEFMDRNLAGWVFKTRVDTPAGYDDTAMMYNTRGELEYEVDASGNRTDYTYTPFGEPHQIFKPGYVGAAVTHTFDEIGRLNRVSEASNGTVAILDYVYGANGDLLREEWVNAPTTSNDVLRDWTYDALGRATSSNNYNVRLVDSGFAAADVKVTRTVQYDALNRVVSETTKVGTQPARTTTSSYFYSTVDDQWDRTINYPATGATPTFMIESYDHAGRLARIDGTMGSEPVDVSPTWIGDIYTGRDQIWSPHPSKDPLTERAELDGLGRRTNWTYRAFDLNALGFPANGWWTRQFCEAPTGYVECDTPLLQLDVVRDVMGRIGSLKWEFGHPITPNNSTEHQSPWRGYTYDLRGALTTLYENQANEANALDPSTLIQHTLAATDIHTFAGSGAERWDYQREAHVGSLVSITNHLDPNIERWATSRPRLTGPTGESRGEGHRLDQVAIDGASFFIEHDDAGRVVTSIDHDIAYTPTGRVAMVSGSSGLAEAYAYGPDGQLAALFDAQKDVKTTFGFDGAQMISAFDGSGNAMWEAVWGQGIDQLFAFNDIANNAGQLVPLVDHRNSVVGTFKTSTQNIDQIAEYDPHGRVRLLKKNETVTCEETGNSGTVCNAPSAMPFGFVSAFRSSETGFVYMRNRWYSPRLGQFISHDPLGYIDSHNPYAYVAFDPINFIDPWGLESWQVWENTFNPDEQYLATSRAPNPLTGVQPSETGVNVALISRAVNEWYIPVYNHTIVAIQKDNGEWVTIEGGAVGHAQGNPYEVRIRNARSMDVSEPTVPGTELFEDQWQSGKIEEIALTTVSREKVNELLDKASQTDFGQQTFSIVPIDESYNCNSFSALCLDQLGLTWPFNSLDDYGHNDPMSEDVFDKKKTKKESDYMRKYLQLEDDERGNTPRSETNSENGGLVR